MGAANGHGHGDWADVRGLCHHAARGNLSHGGWEAVALAVPGAVPAAEVVRKRWSSPGGCCRRRNQPEEESHRPFGEEDRNPKSENLADYYRFFPTLHTP